MHYIVYTVIFQSSQLQNSLPCKCWIESHFGRNWNRENAGLVISRCVPNVLLTQSSLRTAFSWCPQHNTYLKYIPILQTVASGNWKPFSIHSRLWCMIVHESTSSQMTLNLMNDDSTALHGCWLSCAIWASIARSFIRTQVFLQGHGCTRTETFSVYLILIRTLSWRLFTGDMFGDKFEDMLGDILGHSVWLKASLRP